MTACLAQIETRTPPSRIPNQPSLSSFEEHMQQSTQPTQTTQATQPTQSATQPSSATQSSTQADPWVPFKADIDELSQDIVTKEQQLEYLVEHLPGIGTSERAQVERMKELEKELEAVEVERKGVAGEKGGMVRVLEGLVSGVGGMG
jgi:mediator of RNA polymerase II transcription subunit 21